MGPTGCAYQNTLQEKDSLLAATGRGQADNVSKLLEMESRLVQQQSSLVVRLFAWLGQTHKLYCLFARQAHLQAIMSRHMNLTSHLVKI